MNDYLKNVILQLPLRAEKMNEQELIQSFVGIGSVIPILQGNNNHILYGRRGTGKTHIFKYLKSKIEREQNDCCIYIDLRTIGSTKCLGQGLPIDRAISLFDHLLNEIHDQIIGFVESSEDNKGNYLHTVTPEIDKLPHYSNTQVIKGHVKKEIIKTQENSYTKNTEATFSHTPSLDYSSNRKNHETNQSGITFDGHISIDTDYHSLSTILTNVLNLIYPHKIWLFIDEFSAIPQDLQVALSDMIKRVFCPLNNFYFKIAAIEHRSVFMVPLTNSMDYSGLELGADCSTFNLDEIMVFGNNKEQSISFFKDLLFKHINSMLTNREMLSDSDHLIEDVFKDKAFEELVLASEGVPRDAFNILAKAITADPNNPISVTSIRSAAKRWYNEDKLNSVNSHKDANDLLNWIIDTVIGQRRARAFLLQSNAIHPLIDYLYEARVLRIIQQNVSCHDTPGVMYKVYSIDYGCYVHLINTRKKPKGLFEDKTTNGEEYAYCQVPKNDYRSIKKAILNMDAFIQAQNNH